MGELLVLKHIILRVYTGTPSSRVSCVIDLFILSHQAVFVTGGACVG